MKFIICFWAFVASIWIAPASAQTDIVGNSQSEPANVYFFREYAEPTAWAVSIKVDGTKVAALGNRSYTSARLAEGDHQLSIAWPIFSAQSGANRILKIENGKIYVISIGGVSRVVGASAVGLRVQMGSGITIENFDGDALIDFSCCKLKGGKYKPK